MKGEVIFGDHQNKPDVGSNIARQWYDVDQVDVIVDVPTSSVALAINQITKEKNKVFLASGPATADLTGPQCRSEEHTSELQPLMRISYAVFCLKKKKQTSNQGRSDAHYLEKQ